MKLRLDNSIPARTSGLLFGAVTGLFVACSSSDAPNGGAMGAGGEPAESGAAGQAGALRAGAGGSSGSGASGGRVGSAGYAGSAGHPGSAGSIGSSGSAGAAGAAEPPGGSAASGAPNEDAGSGGAAGGEAEGRPEVALVASYLGGMVVYAIDPQSGALKEISGSPFDKGAELFGVATSSTGRFAYATDFSKGLRSYRVALDTGKLAPLTATPIALPGTADGPLAIDPQDRFLYASAEQKLYTYSLAADGVPSLSAVTPQAVAGGVAYIAPDPSGRFVYVAQSFGGILGYRVAADGALSPIAGATFGTSQTPGGALAPSPNGKYLYSSAGGLNAFSIEPTTGALTLLSQTPYTLDVGGDPYARVLALDPAAEFAFTVHMLTDHLSGFKAAASTGLLSELGGPPVSSMQSAYSVGVELSGRFVYVGGDAGGIVGYELDREHGTLKRMADPPFPIDGLQPEMVFVQLDPP